MHPSGRSVAVALPTHLHLRFPDQQEAPNLRAIISRIGFGGVLYSYARTMIKSHQNPIPFIKALKLNPVQLKIPWMDKALHSSHCGNIPQRPRV